MPPARPSSTPLPELTRRRAEHVLAQLCDKRVPPHARSETPPTPDIAHLTHAVDLDPTGVFWG